MDGAVEIRRACNILVGNLEGMSRYMSPSSPVALRPNADHSLLILEVSRSHTTTHHSR